VIAGARRHATITIGGIATAIRTSDEAFLRMVDQRYAGFADPDEAFDYEIDVELTPPSGRSADDDVRVFRNGAQWQIERGDLSAEWDPVARRGRIRQSANPYALDTVLRILHTLALADEGGFLVHASSAVRNDRAFLFAGVSGAGKTTISRLAPTDANVLTDEISYVRKEGRGYVAYGTPFAGDLARPGDNLKAPIAAVYLLAKGSENRIESIDPAAAARALLTNILFFAADRGSIQAVFVAAMDFVESVPIRRLTFVPDGGVWDLVR